jgi:signal transduction histidine kinase
VPTLATAQADRLPVVLTDGLECVRLNPSVSLLTDFNGLLTFPQVRQADQTGRFRAHEKTMFNFGDSRATHWLRFRLESQTRDSKTTWLLDLNDPLLDYSDLYLVYDDGQVVRKQNGDLRPFRQREYHERYQVFKLDLEPGQRLTGYLRVAGWGARHFDLTVWDEVDYLLHLTGENMEIGSYLGIITIVLLYSLFLFGFLRDRIFLIYAIYLLGTMELQFFISGFGGMYLLPDRPELANALPNFLIGFCTVFGSLFALDFLEIRRNFPHLRWGYYTLVGFGVLIMLGALRYSFFTSKLTDLLMVFSAALALGFAVFVYRRGQPLAGYYLISWVFVLAGLFGSALHNAGLVPGNGVIDRLTMWGSAAGIALLSVGLGIRINAFRREKKEAQQRFLHQMKENERIRTRIARDLHDDVGSSLASIVILAESAEQQATGQSSPLHSVLHRIQQNAQNVLEAMSDIVWTAQPHHDHFESVAVRMREFAAEVLETRQIEYQIDIAPGVAHLTLPSGQPYDLYLIFKESLHNIVKYADATRVRIRVTSTHDHLELCVEDDGRGFAANQLPTGSGNGLHNMRRRAAQLGGTLDITSAPGQGTTICLRVPLERFAPHPNV